MQKERSDALDAVLVTAFGGPEKCEDVRPFLQRVTQGRVPAQRLDGVARHYDLFGGKSPVNEVTFNQARALEKVLQGRGVALPVYVAMRCWHPLMPETVARMQADGIRSAAVIILSVFQSKVSWDQYQLDLEAAVHERQSSIALVYTPPLFDRPGFVKTMAQRVADCLRPLSDEERSGTHLVFTAHSIPRSDPHVGLYEEQIHRSITLVTDHLGLSSWHTAYQSRSGRPQDPWLEPDVNQVLHHLADQGVNRVIVVPIGFVCDNIEVLYDLGTQARQTAEERGMAFCLAKTVGDHPDFVGTLADDVMAL